MSHDIVPYETEIPAHLANRVGQPSALAESMSGGIASGAEFPRISIKGARFRTIEGGVEEVLPDTSLEVIVVGANPGISKAWYATAWNPDSEPSAPDCFTMNGIVPDPDSSQPQNDLCASCPQNAWGSRITQQGTEIKACSDKKRLAIVAATDPTGPVYLLEVTPAALSGLNVYNRELKTRHIPPDIIKTIISFDTKASFPKLTFGFGGYIDTEVQPIIEKLFGSDKVNEIIGFNPSASPPTAVALPAPVKTPEAAASLDVAIKEELAPTATFGNPSAPVAEPVAVPEAVPEAATTEATFGKPAEASAQATPAPKPVVEEPEPAPVADSVTVNLAAEITQLMDEVADDAPEETNDG